MVNKAQISSNAPAPKNRMLSQCSAKKKKKKTCLFVNELRKNFKSTYRMPNTVSLSLQNHAAWLFKK